MKNNLDDLRLKYFDFKVHLRRAKDISDLVNENTKFITKQNFYLLKDKHIVHILLQIDLTILINSY